MSPISQRRCSSPNAIAGDGAATPQRFSLEALLGLEALAFLAGGRRRASNTPVAEAFLWRPTGIPQTNPTWRITASRYDLLLGAEVYKPFTVLERA